MEKKFIVILAQLNNDDELYQEVVGVCDTEETAHNMMVEDIRAYLKDNGETIEEWQIKPTSANYKPKFDYKPKQYKIVSVAIGNGFQAISIN